jgi:hypothetical protein
VQAAYTWEKSIDNHSGSLIGTNYGPQNPNDLKAERGLSDFNVGQIFVVNALWNLPALRGKGVLTAVAGGWELTGIVGYSTGNPQTVYSGQDNALLGFNRALSGGERADIIGNPNLAGGRSRTAREAEFFNTAAFAQPGPGQFGSVGRNTIIGPGNLHNDVSLMKKLVTLPHEMGAFQFRFDFFNVLNRTNLNGPNTTMTSQAFGRILSARDQRIGQLALRYDF